MKKTTYMDIMQLCHMHQATLIVVSKYRSEMALMEYYALGHRDFAENRVQELLVKKEHLPKDIRWHMIGHLQRNKVKYIASFITLIQSVDSLALLDEINKQASLHHRQIAVCLQFNLAQETTKSGFMKESAHDVFAYASTLANIKIEGIMVMGPHCEEEDTIKQVFDEAYTLLQKMQQWYPSCKQLSMGMSNDYTLALQKGSTMIRLGSILF